MNMSEENNYTLLTSKESWVETGAVEQLKQVASLPGVHHCYGMPDLHPGKGIPIGVVALSCDTIYPHLAGNDIGCGMGFWQTDLKRTKYKRDKCVKRLHGLETPWEGDMPAWLEQQDFPVDLADEALGTIGGGNHFAELQAIESVHDEDLFQSLGLDKQRLFLLVHSGSRGLGQLILQSHLSEHGTAGLSIDSTGAHNYLQEHDRALLWAKANRQLIAHRFAEQVHVKLQPILDLCHNSINQNEQDGSIWLHRKGAAPSDAGPVIVPGTRGSLSYLVQPINDQSQNGWSLAHGAGRKWNRKSAKARIKGRYTQRDLIHTDLGSDVICEDKDLLFEEAPQAYKHIERVIQDMVEYNMIQIIASLRPMITYKVRRSG